MLIVFYVNDAGIGAKEKNQIDDLVKELEQRGFELTLEVSFRISSGSSLTLVRMDRSK